ncbi:MAG TPA: S-layer homology domain-containing protein [Clostridiales bacterium]|nr:S-layer homology domain-containing protein [Clostridiales bacterium]
MVRKLLSIWIAVITIVATIVSPIGTKRALAAQSEAERVIKSIGIMKTDQGNLSDRNEIVTRSQFAQLLVNASTYKDMAWNKTNLSLYTDVQKNHWAAGYIETAINNGWMSGYLNGTFKPDRGITLQEAVKAVTSLLGYTNSDFVGNTLGGQMALYESKNLNENIKKSSREYLNVADCINLFYNLLNATTKTGVVYAQSIGYSLNSEGKPDYLSIINEGTQGPILLDANWKSKIPFSLDKATFYRDGIECTQYDYNDYDLIYYSEELETVWAYDDKVTGKVESINPDVIAPQSVTVAGKEYSFERSEASIEFSTMGSVKEGDVVTILLGKNGKVGYVLDTHDFNTRSTGVVIETGTHIIKNDEGKMVSSDYVVYVDAAGNEYLQDYDNVLVQFHKGDLIRVTYKKGKAIISEVGKTGAPLSSGSFNGDGSYLGDNKLASNVKIVDMYENNYVSVYPRRLANVPIFDSSVIYYEKNAQGAISHLILDGVTGDQFDYGILTGFASPASVYSTEFNYDYIIDGKTGTATGEFISGELSEEGPKGLLIENNKVVAIRNLYETKVTSIVGSSVYNEAASYTMADECDVYFYLNGEYVLSSIDDLDDISNLKVTAYYDRPEYAGGRVRVIVAENR